MGHLASIEHIHPDCPARSRPPLGISRAPIDKPTTRQCRHADGQATSALRAARGTRIGRGSHRATCDRNEFTKSQPSKLVSDPLSIVAAAAGAPQVGSAMKRRGSSRRSVLSAGVPAPRGRTHCALDCLGQASLGQLARPSTDLWPASLRQKEAESPPRSVQCGWCRTPPVVGTSLCSKMGFRHRAHMIRQTKANTLNDRDGKKAALNMCLASLWTTHQARTMRAPAGRGIDSVLIGRSCGEFVPAWDRVHAAVRS